MVQRPLPPFSGVRGPFLRRRSWESTLAATIFRIFEAVIFEGAKSLDLLPPSKQLVALGISNRIR